MTNFYIADEYKFNILVMDDLMGVLGIGFFLFLLFLTIMWILIPFLIAGVNKRLDKINKNLTKIGELLNEKETDKSTFNND